VCNPRIVEYSSAVEIDDEGCLSSRNDCCGGDICRARDISVEYQDVRGEARKTKLTGFEARVFQHECVLPFGGRAPWQPLVGVGRGRGRLQATTPTAAPANERPAKPHACRQTHSHAPRVALLMGASTRPRT
jgi:hypothetical protein